MTATAAPSAADRIDNDIAMSDVLMLASTTGASPLIFGIVPKADTVVTLDSYLTFTTNELEFELPSVSVAVQTTVVWPTGKTEPDCGLHCTVTGLSRL